MSCKGCNGSCVETPNEEGDNISCPIFEEKYLGEDISEGAVRLSNGNIVEGKEKCSHCIEFETPETWYGYCGLYLDPRECEDMFEEKIE